MARWRAVVAVALAAAVLGAGCAGPGPHPVETGTAARSASAAWPATAGIGIPDSGAWWSATTAADLVPTGIDVVARGPFSDLVVDGEGAAWVRGGWSVARIDPATGGSRVWDVGDDAAFAGTEEMWPAGGAGVWLRGEDRVRLFDGARFSVEVEVPAEVRGGPDGAISDLVEVGGSVWVASPAGVARYANGRWTRLAPDLLAEVTSIAADRSGRVWAAGRLPTDGRSRPVVMRFDAGGAWHEADGEGAPRSLHELVATPAGSILARWARSLTTYDGSRWTHLPLLRLDLGVPGDFRTAVTEDAAIWVLGDHGLARLVPGGSWKSVGTGPDPRVRAIAAAGGSLLALTDDARLLRYRPDGSREVLWQERGAALVASTEGLAEGTLEEGTPEEALASGDVLRPDGVVALTGTEAWAVAGGYPRPFRLSGGSWSEVPAGGLGASPQLIRATDGAVWALTESGLLRFVGTDPPTVRAGITGSQVVPGLDGSVWVVPQWWYGWWYLSSPNPQGEVARPGLVHVTTEGVRTRVPLPAEVWQLSSVVADTRGGVWMALCRGEGEDPCASGGDLLHWTDDRWVPVPHPGRITGLEAASPDGSLWALLWREDAAATELARYLDGAWSSWPLPGAAEDLVPAPDGSLCGLEDGAGALFCVAGDGSLERQTLLGVPGDLSIGGDGSAWISAPGGIGVLPVRVGG